MARLTFLAAMLAALVAAPAVATDFTADERAAILSHGPWPPPAPQDPSNRHLGDAAAVALGERLFSDRRLSETGDLACADCHRPDAAFADGRPVALAGAPLFRNTPSLLNVARQRWFGWGGANDTLWGASIRPIVNPDEMAAGPARVAAAVAADAASARLYEDAFGAAPEADEQTLVRVGKALAAYQATLATPPTAFDAFRDALAAGDAAGMARYPEAAKRGLKLFVGRGACAFCHSGPTFSNGEFDDVAVPYFIAPGKVDQGRYGGLKAFRRSPYTAAGPYSDAPDAADAQMTAAVRIQHRDWGAFRIPSLREAARTAPYMHDGSLATLADVVDHYSEIDEDRLHADGSRLLRPLHLSPGEAADLVAFLETLSSP